MKNSITKRWLQSTMVITFIVVVLILVVGVRSIQAYYYNGVNQILESRALTLSSVLEKAKNSSPMVFQAGVDKEVENFSDRDIIKITIINKTGYIMGTSTGFEEDNLTFVPEFDEVSKKNNVFTQGETELGEKYIAYTFLTPNKGNIYALMLSTSVDKIDYQIFLIIGLITIIGVFVMFAVIYSGGYFINSIVIPVGQVSTTARKIAMGDFSQRLVVRNDDEIGELCESVNYMAEELAQSEQIKNDFISSVSHELRTPLTAIKGWTETLQQIDDKETETRGLEIILTETNRLNEMLEELLDFSRIQSGRFSLMKEEIKLEDVLSETVSMFKERAIKAGISLNYYELERLPMVMGDKNRLKQVFINIIDNSIKYTPENGSITASIAENNGYVVITVEDTGSGIAEEDLKHVKTKFFKGAQSRRGSGIGLAVVDEIVELHGGEFILDSVKYQGTTAIIKIPSVEITGNKLNIEVEKTDE